MTYKHAEAFALMWYACSCGHRERIWNSRDGVTAFGSSCPSCGNIMDHVDWKKDQIAVNHKLHRGQRFWRDGTVEDAVKIVERSLKRFAEDGHPPPTAVANKMRAEAANQTGNWQLGWPMLDIAS